MMKSYLKLALTGLFATFILTGCVSTTNFGAGSERKQFVLVSQDYVVKKADKEYAKKNPYKGKNQYSYNEEKLVNIMNSLIPYADEYVSKDRKIEWAIHSWSTKKVNAGALANGIVLVSPLLANNKEITDDELAFIVAHEMSHIVRQHHREHLTWKRVIRPTLLVTAIATSGITATVGAVGHDIYGLGFSKTIEKEADLLALEIYSKAGYKHENILSLYQKVQPIFKKHHPFLSRMPTVLSTHPSFKQRAKMVHKNLDKINALQKNHVALKSENLIVTKFAKKQVVDNIKFTVVNDQNREEVYKRIGLDISEYKGTEQKIDSVETALSNVTTQTENNLIFDDGKTIQSHSSRVIENYDLLIGNNISSP